LSGTERPLVLRVVVAACLVVDAVVHLRLAAFAVGLSAVAAIVAYRYVNVLALGPLPTTYEPVWFFEKSLSAFCEALAPSQRQPLWSTRNTVDPGEATVSRGAVGP
jgi:hypothetical protein